MQQIEAIIDQFKLQEVRNALDDLGIEDYMETTIKYHQPGQVMKFRGASLTANIVEKIKLEIFAEDDSIARIVEAIGAITRTGRKEGCRMTIHQYQEVN